MSISYYKHFKGGLYVFLHRGHYVTGSDYKEVVIYRALVNSEIYVRDAKDWEELVIWPDQQVRPRFIPLEEAP